jgi:hypothetical protein
LPSPGYVNSPVDELTSHVEVVLLTLEYVMAPSPSVEARLDGINGDCVVVIAVVGAHVTV